MFSPFTVNQSPGIQSLFNGPYDRRRQRWKQVHHSRLLFCLFASKTFHCSKLHSKLQNCSTETHTAKLNTYNKDALIPHVMLPCRASSSNFQSGYLQTNQRVWLNKLCVLMRSKRYRFPAIKKPKKCKSHTADFSSTVVMFHHHKCFDDCPSRRWCRHNCSHLRNVLYNNGDLHKWWSCSIRNCISLCVTRLMRGRPTCNKYSQT